jgi:hypothetical protein
LALNTQAAEMARAVRDRNPMSIQFVGFIREYRYSAGRKGEMPSHRFYLECGNGVWLYARVPSAQFERIMRDMEIDFTQEALDGRMMVCEGNGTVNAMVPIEFVEPFDPMLRDRFFNYLYVGAPVLCDSGSKPRAGLATSLSSDGKLRVRLDDADSDADFLLENVTRRF